ncbi:MAG TPA: hypothetical protein VMU84_16620 [Thermoanaerobaculia bacterium]|nr:hypothetical protein [Thermoanaerobaculia bacterium]
MKRAAFALVLVFVATAAFALDTTKRGDRIGVLRAPARWADDSESLVADAVIRYLTEELKRNGFDAFDERRTLDQLIDEGGPAADWYVEIASSDADADAYGGIGVSTRSAGIEVAVVVSRVAAQLRVYDGRTLELVDTRDLRKRSTAIVPTAAGIGSRHAYVWLALPIVQWAQLRSASKNVAQNAAAAVIAVARPAASEGPKE